MLVRMLTLLILTAAAALPVRAASQAATDGEALSSCVNTKAGPEGDLPPPGALRSKMLKEMEGGPQACIGTVRRACAAAGGTQEACTTRETAGWLAALKLDPDNGRAATRKKWEAPAGRIRAQALALCEGAAAMSAWGHETVKAKGSYGAQNLSRCILEAVAQQALIMMVHVRGN